MLKLLNWATRVMVDSYHSAKLGVNLMVSNKSAILRTMPTTTGDERPRHDNSSAESDIVGQILYT